MAAVRYQIPAGSHLRGFPVLVQEVPRRVWGLRLRRTEQEFALALLLMVPTAHVKDGGVRIGSFRSRILTPLAPVYASLITSRYQRKTRGQVDRCSFLVRRFHPLH